VDENCSTELQIFREHSEKLRQNEVTDLVEQMAGQKKISLLGASNVRRMMKVHFLGHQVAGQ
jgi:hypothetical protein